MTVWRIKLNSMRAEEDGAVDWDEAKAYCRKAGLVGVGWGLSKLRNGARLQTVLTAWNERPDGKGGADTIARLASQVQTGDLMWTRDGLGQFWLCQITGSWRGWISTTCAVLAGFNGHFETSMCRALW
jgi:hypothetical protein